MKLLRFTQIACALVVLVTLLGPVHSTHAQGFPWPRMAISPDGTLVAVSGPVYDEIHSPIHILDANTGQLLMTFRDPDLSLNIALSWSPDGTRVLSGDSAGRIDIWNVIDGTHTVLRRDAAPSEGAGWSPAGNAILRMSAGFIQLLDPTTGKELPNSLLPTLTLVRAAAWNADGSRLAAVGREGIKVWDMTTTDWPLITEFVDDHSTWDLAWSTDGSWLATAGQNGVWVYNTTIWQVDFVLPLDTEGMDSVTWHPNGTLIAGSTGDTVYVWDVQTQQVITTYPITVAMDVEWHPDGERLFFAGGPQGRPYVNGIVLGSPSADAGQDQSIVNSDGSGAETVTLDGSASSDLDGNITTYHWYENDTLIAEGVTPQVELGVGVHVITLTVTDNDNLTSSDEVTVTVVPASGCVPVAPSDPPTYTVAAGDTAGLVAAISAANANPDPDIIALEAGTYTLTASNNTLYGKNGLPVINTPITIYGNCATIARNPAAQPFRLFYVTAAGNLTLYDLTLTGGDGGTSNGGAIYSQGAVTATNTTIANSTAPGGGGIRSSGTLTLVDSRIEANSTTGSGGGV